MSTARSSTATSFLPSSPRHGWPTAGCKGNGVVATVMSNLGLERFLGGLKLDLLRTPVGDRYVVERDARRTATIWAASSPATSS